MGVTQAYAEQEVSDFNAFYDAGDADLKSCYGGHSSLDNYRCCKQMELRPFKEGDCPDGVTIGPVIWEGAE